MPKIMAVTHADLEPGRRRTELGSNLGVFLMVATILCGLSCFILCLIAEATRSEMTWIETGDKTLECVYSGSGKTALICASSAFVALAFAVMIEHAFLLVAVSKLPPSALDALDPDLGSSKTLAWQGGFFFVSTWICFAIGEIMLLIGLSVESGHLRNWSTPRPTCLVIKQGLFSASGVFAFTSVFLAAGLYLTALKAQRISNDHEHVRRQILEAAALYASPPGSPGRPGIAATARENPTFREGLGSDHQMVTGFVNPLAYSTKVSTLACGNVAKLVI